MSSPRFCWLFVTAALLLTSEGKTSSSYRGSSSSSSSGYRGSTYRGTGYNSNTNTNSTAGGDYEMPGWGWALIILTFVLLAICLIVSCSNKQNVKNEVKEANRLEGYTKELNRRAGRDDDDYLWRLGEQEGDCCDCGCNSGFYISRYKNSRVQCSRSYKGSSGVDAWRREVLQPLRKQNQRSRTSDKPKAKIKAPSTPPRSAKSNDHIVEMMQNKNWCSGCGKELTAEAKFCMECGAKATKAMVNPNKKTGGQDIPPPEFCAV